MTIGLITEPKSYSRKYFFKRILNLKVREKILSPANPFDVNAEVLPYSPKALEKMSRQRLRKIIEKKVRLLQKNGITRLMLSSYLYKLCNTKFVDTGSFANGNGKNVFLALMPLCLRQVSKEVGIGLFSSSICIRDTKMDRISEYLMRELCFDTKKMCLCTKNLKSARAFCERFCDETGLWIDVCDKIGVRYDILLDVDNFRIKFGNDLYVRDVCFGLDFCGYKVCQTDVASLLPSLNLSTVNWIYSYEK